MMSGLNRTTVASRVTLFLTIVCVFFGVAYIYQRPQFREDVLHPFLVSDGAQDEPGPGGHVPQELLELGVYAAQEFEKAKGRRAPPFWSCRDVRHDCNRSDLWGPCFAPKRHTDWTSQVEIMDANNQTAVYHDKNDAFKDKDDLSDYCKPGFLIIGAGKCGTSSLYHYVTSHPRVLPAVEKQIHYFKYYYDYSMKWYLRHFPTATSFLASGALLSGEASPGYLPYPDVVHRVRNMMHGPRIVVVGRNPLERAYSSYKYNYVDPTIEEMRRGRVRKIHAGRNESYYQQFLFSFQNMIEAELQQLRKCMDPVNGSAIVKARDKWSRYAWAQQEMARRENSSLPPLVDLDGYCYGQGNKSVPREQWAEMMVKEPTRVITTRNLHLKQALIGRGLYFAPLEWWYAGMPPHDIFFLCTEELSDFSGAPLLKLSRFLGLPDFNFSAVLQEGAFNVGGHRGYDEEVSWQEISEEAPQTDVIPLSDETRLELLEFVRPYNERLFDLVGRRCDWSS